MKKKVLLLLAVLLVSLLVYGCGTEEVAPGTDDNANDVVAAPDGTPEFTWRMQVIHHPGQSSYHLNEKAAQEVYEASGGRLKIDVHPTGTFASSMEGFQAAGDGVFEMHSSWPVYIRGINFAWNPLGDGNMSADPHDKWVWIYEHGGWDLLQEGFDEMNLQLIATEVWGSEVLHTNTPISRIEDLVGLVVRTSDPRIFEEFDIGAISLPLEEVFTAFETGAVDAAEFGHIDYNVGLGLTDIADYGIFPDFWNVHNVTTVVVNKQAWDTLPSDLQKIVELAFRANEFNHWTKSQYDSAVAMKELEEAGEMEFIRLEAEGFAELRRLMYEVEKAEIEQHGGLTAEVYESLHEFYELWYPYKKMAAHWGYGLEPMEIVGRQE